MCSLAEYEYCILDDLAKAVLKQVELEVEHIKDTMEIVEETYPPNPVIIRYLREK